MTKSEETKISTCLAVAKLQSLHLQDRSWLCSGDELPRSNDYTKLTNYIIRLHSQKANS